MHESVNIMLSYYSFACTADTYSLAGSQRNSTARMTLHLITQNSFTNRAYRAEHEIFAHPHKTFRSICSKRTHTVPPIGSYDPSSLVTPRYNFLQPCRHTRRQCIKILIVIEIPVHSKRKRRTATPAEALGAGLVQEKGKT